MNGHDDQKITENGVGSAGKYSIENDDNDDEGSDGWDPNEESDEDDFQHESGWERNERMEAVNFDGGDGIQKNNVLRRSGSALGLDSIVESRRDMGELMTNVVHIEVPFGKPIQEVYYGVHDGPVLGSGISGLVRRVTHKATGAEYAVKCLDLGLVETSEGLEQLRDEIIIMCQLDHPNIVRLEEVYESHSEIYLVQELCLGGELFDRLDEQPDYHYTEAECAKLVKQMLTGTRYLHSKGIIHRDLKLENFLFSSHSADSELKMIDFGISKHFQYGELLHEGVGTPYTVAPEVIRGSYDERCDIWAIGVITYLLLSGDAPFGGVGGPEAMTTVRDNILSGEFTFEPEDIWSRVSLQAKDFICELLVTDPNQRPTAEEAQKHDWLREWADREKDQDDHQLNPNVVNALVSFKEYSDMRKLLCEVLSFTLLPDQIRELRKEFEKMDRDQSGEIALWELKEVLITNAGAGSLGGLTEQEVEDIFNAMRVRKSETRIHWHEFIAAGLSQCQVDERNLRLAFDRLDSDHKGFITLEDVMDLMGTGTFESEEALARMWGESVQAANCSRARITYDDFLLLMKGQTKEPEPTLMMSQDMAEDQDVPDYGLDIEELEALDEGPITMEDMLPLNSEPPSMATSTISTDINDEALMDMAPRSTVKARHRRARSTDGSSIPVGLLPSIPGRGLATRVRSRSFDNLRKQADEEGSAYFTADARRAMLMPEADHTLDDILQDETKTNLVVNRQLYRAHRQMRHAVLEATKRFEEKRNMRARQQEANAADADAADTPTIMSPVAAASPASPVFGTQVSSGIASVGSTENATLVGAGLVMRHGQPQNWLEKERRRSKTDESGDNIRKSSHHRRSSSDVLHDVALLEDENIRKSSHHRRSSSDVLYDVGGI